MKRFLTAQLAACAIALLALPAMADENPPPPQSSSAQTESAARSSVSTTVVVAVPVVSTGHLVPDLAPTVTLNERPKLGLRYRAPVALAGHHVARIGGVHADLSTGVHSFCTSTSSTG